MILLQTVSMASLRNKKTLKLVYFLAEVSDSRHIQ